MNSYQTILKTVLEKGRRKSNRTGTDTFAVPNVHFSHDMQDGFPLVTTKKMAWKPIRVELQGFIHGVTSKKWYQDRGCRIWDEWANPEAVQAIIDSSTVSPFDRVEHGSALWNDIQENCDDLGPIYGYQWRNWNAPPDELFMDGHPDGVDQLKEVINKLKTNPNDRRLVVSAWNPSQLHMMALPPCHMMFVLTHIDGELSLHWTQRSCDIFLGVPFNIASYALLLELICKESGMRPGNLSGMLCDCHAYENHMAQIEEQVSRTPYPLPTLELDNWTNFWEWKYKDAVLHNYQHHPAIKAEVAV